MRSIEHLIEIADSNEVVDIWRVVDHLLDLRSQAENTASVDEALASVGVVEDGPSIILGERVKKIIKDYQESSSKNV